MITADLTKNPKQESYFLTVMAAAFGDNPFRYLFYGGAIRGGKTYACLVTLIVLCKIFPGSKWYVLRRSFTNITETTLPTMQKILGKSANVKWNRDKANYYVEFLATGSRIFFAGEDFARDPKLTWMLGLECNGFFLEQMEELQELTMEMCISRSGSWYIDKMPTPLILGSFNPTLTWVRNRIYVPWEEGKLVAPWYFEEAFPDDNPFVTQEQWANWNNMDAELFKQFIKGSWDFAKASNVFAYAFNEKKHHRILTYDDNLPLYLSFDFNVEPITCLIAQHDMPDGQGFVHILKELRLLNSDIDELCEQVAGNFPGSFYMVTGDASGSARTALKKNLNYYKAIRQNLFISPLQLKVPKKNPLIRNTRVLCNSLLNKQGNYWINTLACPHLTIDLNTVTIVDGDIEKGADKRKTHLLDCFRYYNWSFHRKFLDNSLYQSNQNE